MGFRLARQRGCMGERRNRVHSDRSYQEVAGMKYKIVTTNGIKEVDGEPVAIPGFEEYSFFVHHISIRGGYDPDGYVVSEVTSGRCFGGCMGATEQESESITKQFLTSYGKEKFAKRLSKMEKICEVKS